MSCRAVATRPTTPVAKLKGSIVDQRALRGNRSSRGRTLQAPRGSNVSYACLRPIAMTFAGPAQAVRDGQERCGGRGYQWDGDPHHLAIWIGGRTLLVQLAGGPIRLLGNFPPNVQAGHTPRGMLLLRSSSFSTSCQGAGIVLYSTKEEKPGGLCAREHSPSMSGLFCVRRCSWFLSEISSRSEFTARIFSIPIAGHLGG